MIILVACLEGALVQPFRVCFSLLLLIKMPWGKAFVLYFIGHPMLFWLCLQLSVTSNVCLPILWSFLEHILCYGFLMLGCFMWLMKHAICFWLVSSWYLISMFHFHSCLTWCYVPFRGMLGFTMCIFYSHL